MTKDKKHEKYDDKASNETPEEIKDSGETEETQPEVKSEAETYLDNWKRTQADFLNYKRRCEQEKEDTIKFGNSMLLLALLPVLDDLQRALDSAPKDIDNVPWVEGIRLIERKFNSCLESQGVKVIKTEGEAFDPNIHEAALHVDGEDGMIIKELQKGYKLHDRVIRPAMVAVGNGNK
jgi:molecular chaperone GrpE